VWDSLIRKYEIRSVVIVTFSVFYSKAVSLQYNVHSRRHACDNHARKLVEQRRCQIEIGEN
jgi:hypothetical protein